MVDVLEFIFKGLFNDIIVFVQMKHQEIAWQKHFDKLSPKQGMAAPDFELSDILGL